MVVALTPLIGETVLTKMKPYEIYRLEHHCCLVDVELSGDVMYLTLDHCHVSSCIFLRKLALALASMFACSWSGRGRMSNGDLSLIHI